MEIPKYSKIKNYVKKLKFCKYPDCEKEFFAKSPIQKYCSFHQEIKNRKRKRKYSLDRTNKHFYHDFHYATEIEFTCELPGCGNTFKTLILPKQYIVPRFCEYHRNEEKRKRFLKCISIEEKPEYFNGIFFK